MPSLVGRRTTSSKLNTPQPPLSAHGAPSSAPWRGSLQLLVLALLAQAQAFRNHELSSVVRADGLAPSGLLEDARVCLLQHLREGFRMGTCALGHGETPASPNQVRVTFGLCLILGFVAPMLSTWKVHATEGIQPQGFVSEHLHSAGSGEQPAPCPARIAYVDLWRVLCVAAVVVCHAYEEYHAYNIMASQQWVLQILVLVSGACFARRRAGLADYCARLLFIWSVGSSLTWLAMIYRGQRWWERPFLSVSYQMLFVAIPLAGALAAAPLKEQALAEGAAARAAALRSCGLYALVCCAALALRPLLPALTACDPEPQVPRLLLESGLALLVAAAAHHLLQERHRGLASWAQLAVIYGLRLAHPEPRPGSEFHLLDLYAWAVFEQLCPLAGHCSVGLAMAQWWPVWGFGCGLLLIPGASTTFAQHPPEYLLPRVRFYLLEAVIVVAFTTIPRVGMGQTLPVPESLRAYLPWLSRWALFAFCSHRAFLVLLPAHWALLALFAPGLLSCLVAAPKRVPSPRCLHP